MNHRKLAIENFLSGCNCSQAIMLAFCDITGLDEKTALKLSSSFGGGMGRLREVCGAFSGILMVVGCLYGYDEVKNPELKKEHYKRVQELAEAFKKATKGISKSDGSIVCRELLGLNKDENSDFTPTERTPEFYRKRPCGEIIGTAAEILDLYIEEHPI